MMWARKLSRSDAHSFSAIIALISIFVSVPGIRRLTPHTHTHTQMASLMRGGCVRVSPDHILFPCHPAGGLPDPADTQRRHPSQAQRTRVCGWRGHKRSNHHEESDHMLVMLSSLKKGELFKTFAWCSARWRRSLPAAEESGTEQPGAGLEQLVESWRSVGTDSWLIVSISQPWCVTASMYLTECRDTLNKLIAEDAPVLAPAWGHCERAAWPLTAS